jgi:hypothetical protein
MSMYVVKIVMHSPTDAWHVAYLSPDRVPVDAGAVRLGHVGGEALTLPHAFPLLLLRAHLLLAATAHLGKQTSKLPFIYLHLIDISQNRSRLL